MGKRPAGGQTGGCLCGGVRYEARGPLRDVVNCHCGRCRRTHDHFGAYTEAASEDLALLEDRGLRWYVADGRERGFCRECGASLFWRRAGTGRTSIAAGTLDEPTGLRTVADAFVDSRGDYYQLADELPRFSGARHATPRVRATGHETRSTRPGCARSARDPGGRSRRICARAPWRWIIERVSCVPTPRPTRPRSSRATVP